MKAEPNLLFLEDRMPSFALGAASEKLVSSMLEWSVGRLGEMDIVHFCGIISIPDVGVSVFLPREARSTDKGANLQVAKTTMKALARFGNESSQRDFESDGDKGNLNLLSVVKKLADDFKRYGVFSEREKVQTRNCGKIDWRRTIAKEMATPDRSGRPVYLDLHTTKPRSDTNSTLSRIQASVIREIITTHGWWLDSKGAHGSELRLVAEPEFRRSIWLEKLTNILPSLYSERSLFLAKYLSYYLLQTRASASGSFVFGVTDFHTVWETMLRETIHHSDDTGRDWSKDLPRPVYHRKDGATPEARRRGMIPDIIFQDKGKYILIDAKYYAATSSENAPGWPDIAKQLFYELALQDIVGEDKQIENYFVFPSKSGSGPFEKVTMRNRYGVDSDSFRDIKCRYAVMEQVLSNYSARVREIRFETE